MLHPTHCTQVARIFLSIGYDICFVVALVKTVRIAYIFRKVSPTKKVTQLHSANLTRLVYSFSTIESARLATSASVSWHRHDRGHIHYPTPHTDLCKGRYKACH